MFAAGDGSAHVADFEAGETIRISGVPGGFAGLVIEQIGDNAVIRHGDGDTITLQGVSADSLGADDFEFPAAGNAPRDGGDGDPRGALPGDVPSGNGGGGGAPQGASPGDVPSGNNDGGVAAQVASVGDATTDDSSGGGGPRGGSGDDTLDGGAGDDVLRGRAGDDTLNGHGGDDTLGGGRGNDTLDGGGGGDTLRGARGDDILTGGRGSDTFVFRSGDGGDTITDFGEGDRIRLDGVSVGFGALDIRRDGTDTVIHHGTGDTITLRGVSADSLGADDFLLPDAAPGLPGTQGSPPAQGAGQKATPLPGGTGQAQTPNKPHGAGQSQRVTTPHDDDWDGEGTGHTVHRGTDDGDILHGSGVLLGGKGDDTLFVQGDHSYGSILHGGAGRDTLHGGTGDDTLYGGTGGGYLLGYLGDDTLYGGTGDDYLYGGAGDDTLHGGADGDYLHGGAGDDTFYGGTGGDYLHGGAGDDTLHGGADRDYLYGNQGDDILYGGDGDDILIGDRGDDTFVFTNDSSSSGDVDTIVDFGGGDTIQLSGFTGVDGFSDLEGRITMRHGVETVIDLTDVGGGLIVLRQVAAEELDASDFDFG